MKIIAFLMALVVLFGTIYPCCPSDGCQDEITAPVSNEPSDPDACSPFFACNSCAGFVTIIKPFILNVPENKDPLYFEKYKSFTIADFYSSLFQPPRLV